MLNARILVLIPAFALAAACVDQAADMRHAEPPAATLASWNTGTSRDAIESFVGRVTDPSGADFVPAAERIAVFDNDGTLWAEQPLYFQVIFAIDLMRVAAEADPVLAAQEPYKTLLADGLAGAGALDPHSLLAPLVAVHGGTTTAQFRAAAAAWLATARHPTLDRAYTELTYTPMVELLEYLRAHGFETWIVSGGGVEFIRVFSDDAYGIPQQQVVGSRIKSAFALTDDGPVINRLGEIEFVDDGPGKPVGIATFIGRRPILAGGNSDGDLAMLQYTDDGDGPALAIYIHHDDPDREWAYDRDSNIGRLDAGLDAAAARGWTVVSMRDDWNRVFAEPD
jgi:hypothetical protein